MQRGGFDVIIGNPPYVEYSAAKVGYAVDSSLYKTLATKNLYAFVFERSVGITTQYGYISLIVQLTVASSERLYLLQNMITNRGSVWLLPFPRRPESMFDGVEMPVAIVVSSPRQHNLYTTRVNRFYTEERSQALMTVAFNPHDIKLDASRIAKIGMPLEERIFSKLQKSPSNLASLVQNKSPHLLYYQEACRYWLKACHGLPYSRRNGQNIAPPHGRTIRFTEEAAAALAVCLMNSSLFYWYYSVFSDCEHVNDSLVKGVHLPCNWEKADWIDLSHSLSEDLAIHAKRKIIHTAQGHTIEYDEIKAMHSKPIIDEIDRVLAKHYGFSDEELDYLINYDIKYRMGAEDAGA